MRRLLCLSRASDPLLYDSGLSRSEEGLRCVSISSEVAPFYISHVRGPLCLSLVPAIL